MLIKQRELSIALFTTRGRNEEGLSTRKMKRGIGGEVAPHAVIGSDIQVRFFRQKRQQRCTAFLLRWPD